MSHSDGSALGDGMRVTAPSTPDLVSRILAAIDRAEKAAGSATPGPWMFDPAADGFERRIKHPPYNWGSPQLGDCEIAGPGWEGGGVWTAEDTAHICLNDPDAVLRRCAADRKIVAEYEETRQICKEHPGDLGLVGAVLALLGVVKRLAEGYDITEEATTP